MMRLVFAAVVLMLIWRPALGALRGRHAADLIAFGVALAAMNTTFYPALDRIPWGSRSPSSSSARSAWRSPPPAAGSTCCGRCSPAPGSCSSPRPRERPRPARRRPGPARRGFWAAYIVLTARIGQALPEGRAGACDGGRQPGARSSRRGSRRRVRTAHLRLLAIGIRRRHPSSAIPLVEPSRRFAGCPGHLGVS